MLSIQNLSMATDLADFVYPEIKYPSRHTSDKSLLAVAKILLAKRGFPLEIISPVLFCRDDIDYDGLKKRFGLFTLEMKQDELYLVSFDRGFDHMVELVNPEIFGEGFVEVKPVEVYVAKRLMSSHAVIMCNTQRHITVVILDVFNVEAEHTIASILPALLPWAFKEMPRTKEEEEALMALGDFSSNTNEIISKLENLSACYNLDELAVDFYLKDFSAGVKDGLVKQTRQQLDNISNEIEQIHEQMSQLLLDRYEKQTYLLGLEMSKNDDENLIRYFKDNDKIQVVGKHGKGVEYIITGYMDLFDADVYEDIRNTEESYLYQAYKNADEPTMSSDDYLVLMDALFKDELVKLKMCSAWKLSPFSIGCCENYSFPKRYDDYMRNSHLQNYGCYGSFRADLDKAIERQDFEYAVDISSAENGNINLCDSIVIPNSFIPTLLQNKEKIIELPDGRSVTTVEAVKWIKEVKNGKAD